jgi:hypothetical protein
MTKKKLIQLSLSLFSLLLLMVVFGCEVNQTKSNGGSGSNSGTTPPEQPAHGQVTINLMEQNLFTGTNLNSTYWSNLEAYCKAGPTLLIIADLNLVPGQMTRSGFRGRVAAQLYGLATSYAGLDWYPREGDDDAYLVWEARDEIVAWWSRYVQAVLQVMQKAPQTTAIIIVNDGEDMLGFRLGPATYDNLSSVANRLGMGDIYQYKTRSSRFLK